MKIIVDLVGGGQFISDDVDVTDADPQEVESIKEGFAGLGDTLERFYLFQSGHVTFFNVAHVVAITIVEG